MRKATVIRLSELAFGMLFGVLFAAVIGCREVGVDDRLPSPLALDQYRLAAWRGSTSE